LRLVKGGEHMLRIEKLDKPVVPAVSVSKGG
jgi:hypothetical protein